MSEALPTVPSIYEGKRLTPLDHLKLSAYWFGSNFVWGALLGPVMSQQMNDLYPRDPAKMLGLLYTIGALPALIVPLVIGPISDRCTSPFGRRRPFIAAGGILALVGLLLMLLAAESTVLALYIAGYLLLQLGSNTALAAYSGVIPDLVPDDQRGIASGYMAMMSQVSTLFGAFFGGQLLGGGQTVATYAMLFGVFAVFLGFSIVGIHEHPLKGPVPKMVWSEYHPAALFRYLLHHRDFGWVWLTRALMMLGFYAIQPFILYYLRDVAKVGNPAKEAGIVLGIILIGATISGVLGGAISDRVGRKRVVYFSSWTIALMCVAFMFCTNLVQVGIAGVLFGIGYGAYISVDWALGTDVLPSKEHAGKDMAVWHISMTLPQQIAPLLGGLILSQFAIAGTKDPARYSLGGYIAIFSFAAVCFLAGAELVKQVRSAR